MFIIELIAIAAGLVLTWLGVDGYIIHDAVDVIPYAEHIIGAGLIFWGGKFASAYLVETAGCSFYGDKR